MRFLILLAASLLSLWGADTTAAPVMPEFATHVIESKMPGGYSVIVVDVNKDGKPDVIGMTSRLTELAWYENPTWERHVMVKDMKGLVNMAAADITLRSAWPVAAEFAAENVTQVPSAAEATAVFESQREERARDGPSDTSPS